ncbi:MAG: hypothetical protein AAF828_12560 [Bacteroidota bacterium]
MKSPLSVLLLFAVILMMGCNASQGATAQSSGSRFGNQSQMEEQRATLIAKMNLSAEQETEFITITDRYLAEAENLRSSAGGNRQQMMQEARQLRDRQNAELQEVLTDSQFEIYQAETSRRRPGSW